MVNLSYSWSHKPLELLHSDGSQAHTAEIWLLANHWKNALYESMIGGYHPMIVSHDHPKYNQWYLFETTQQSWDHHPKWCQISEPSTWRQHSPDSAPQFLAFQHLSNRYQVGSICIYQHLQRGAKWFRFRVSIHHPLGFNWHPFEGAGICCRMFLLFKGFQTMSRYNQSSTPFFGVTVDISSGKQQRRQAGTRGQVSFNAFERVNLGFWQPHKLKCDFRSWKTCHLRWCYFLLHPNLLGYFNRLNNRNKNMCMYIYVHIQELSLNQIFGAPP